MALHLIVDGYNLLTLTGRIGAGTSLHSEMARESFLRDLAAYRQRKSHPITVVFDGWQQGRLAGHRERSKGIEVIFSKVGEKADDVLKRLAAEKKDGVLIVTSDQEVASYAQKKGSSVVSAADFGEKMEMARFYDLKGGGGEEIFPDRPVAPDKKGPSRRLSKSKRKEIAAAKKL